MTTSASRDENRLTDSDRVRIVGALTTYLAATDRVTFADRLTTATRVAAHSIGCSLYDLRDSELAEIDTAVRNLIIARNLNAAREARS